MPAQKMTDGSVLPDGAINEASLKVVPLHRRPDLKKQCCDLVNSEWPRSETARMLSLNTSCDRLPTCLVLLAGDDRVVGHCKLTPIPSERDSSCFVESVVVERALRGRGLGAYLMRASEEYCRGALGLSRVRLSTIDKRGFYERLGYVECEPVNIYGGFVAKSDGDSKSKGSFEGSKTDGPPPPPPPMINFGMSRGPNKPKKVYMIKNILPG